MLRSQMTLADEILEALKSDSLRLHGNGFIQLNLPGNRRLHVWSDKMPSAQKVDTGIHDHRFSFQSTIFLGRLTNSLFEFTPSPEGEYRIYNPKVRRGEDTVLLPSEQVGDFRRTSATDYGPGQAYRMVAEDFHTTGYGGLTATVMQKTFEYLIQPRIACPLEMEPDNIFTRYDVDRRELEDIVLEVMQRLQQ